MLLYRVRAASEIRTGASCTTKREASTSVRAERSGDKLKEYNRQYYTKNKEKIKRYQLAHRKEMSLYYKSYSQKNETRIKEYLHEYRDRNKERITASKKLYGRRKRGLS
jgi:hypothetical protein